MFWGLFLFLIFSVFLATGGFEMRSGAIRGGRTSRLISRENSPLVYWLTESSILIAAVSLSAVGVYRARAKTNSGDA
jgi:hypothetical protein